MEIPKEQELISFFGSKPEREDETDLFFYDKSTFTFENENEFFELEIAPFYDKFILTVKDKETNETLSYIELRSVQKLEVVSDQQQSKIRLSHGESDIYQNILEFKFKPRFNMVFEEQYR
ncbi:hypothetical protein QWY14_03535 [Planococcus sp. N028]|uniref:Uncharacterized protein n=1 Tax=Planococcus shixiaomingii TaxID=3058393 RepID=A0ABT8MZI2_9BACL|nr:MULTISPECIES: hypothetical protein [unclassified Planococcus (in: firmicutes)]MDN7240844.1 hypothetical protein [Planococcus sp. N028]WKA53088.1 hypothetical protein QWY21_10470 [Planococcus sp. N022]